MIGQHATGVLGQAVRGLLGVVGDPDADQAALAARLGLLGPQIVIGQHLLCQVDGGQETAGVDLEPGDGDVGVLVDQVSLAHVERIEVELAGQIVDGAFDGETGRRTGDTAVGPNRHLVRADAERLELVVPDLVGSGDVAGRNPDLHGGGPGPGRIGAVVDDDPCFESEDRAVPTCRELEGVDVLAGVDAGREILTAIRDPAHGPVEQAREIRNEDFLGIERALDAKPTADVRRDDPEAILGETEGLRRRRSG